MSRKTSGRSHIKRTKWSREAELLRAKLEKAVQPPQQTLPDDPVEFCNGSGLRGV